MLLFPAGVYTRQTFPYEWANICNNLAVSYSKRIKQERAENLERAISLYEQSLEVYRRQAFPYEWARSMSSLAEVYRGRIRGERAENIERAIDYLQLSQKVYTRQATPKEWAQSCNHLAAAYNNRIRGARAENIERAIDYLKLSQEIWTRQASPKEWAASCNNLAMALYNRIRGERAENLERAIDYFKQSQEVFGAFSFEWATSINNLALAYHGRIKGERADNIERAIDYLKQSLEVYTPQSAPFDWARSMNNLASAYNNRIRGERAENLERAIYYCEQSLEVYTRQAFPFEWARSMNNLAAAYSDRIRGERADNIERAIEYHEQSLEVYTRQAFPFEWARSCNNLALAYSDRIRGEPPDNIERAISLYKQALEVVTRQAAPFEWARSINNLATAYQKRMRGQPTENLERAIEYHEQLQEVWTRQAFPYEWARSMNNLAEAYLDRIKGERAGNLERAIDYLKQSLEVRTPQSFPQDCRYTAYLLGFLLYYEGRVGSAREAFVTAHEAAEALRGEVSREGGRRELAGENADLYARLVFCCLHEEDEEAAFEYAAAGKGRVFADLLASARFDLSAVGDDDSAFAADWEKYREFRQQIDNLLVQLRGDKGTIRGMTMQRAGETFGSQESEPIPSAILQEQLRATQKKAAAHWEEMTLRYPALTACESAPTLTAQDARKLSAQLGATLVEYYQHAEGWCAFVVTPQEVRYVALPAVDDELIKRMRNWTQKIRKPKRRNKHSYRRLSEWYQAVIAPLKLPKEEASAVVLAPFGPLHVLPLTAARHPKSERYVSEEHTLAFAPSLGALSVAVKENSKDQSLPSSWKQALLVAYPGKPPLDHVVPEAEAIAKYFPEPTPLHKEAATPDEVVKEARGKQVIHFGCHGSFDSAQPEESGLMLADGWLTVQRIITDLRLKQCQLTTLGACKSAETALGSGDEHVGLIQALMTAGTPSVVASLWSVNDTATRALFEHFYANITKGQPPAIALRQAAEEVRQDSRWKHPYYWGAFAISGLAHGPIRPALPQIIEQATLSKQSEAINSQAVRGIVNMNEKEIYDDAIDLLEQISEDADYFAEKMGPTNGAIVVQRLAALSQQAATIESQASSEAQLLALCSAIHKFVKEIPAFHELLILEYSDVTQMQKERGVDEEDIKHAASQQQTDKKAPDTIRQYLVESRRKLERHLTKLEQQQNKKR